MEFHPRCEPIINERTIELPIVVCRLLIIIARWQAKKQESASYDCSLLFLLFLWHASFFTWAIYTGKVSK